MTSHIALHSNIAFDTINKILSDQVKNIELNEKLILNAVKIEKAENTILAIANVSGVYDGDIHINFVPRYDSEKEYLHLDHLKINIASNNFFAKSASWMANKMFGGTIDEKFESILNVQLKKTKLEWTEKLKHFEIGPEIFLQVQAPKIDVQNPEIYDQGISCTLVIDGQLMIQG